MHFISKKPQLANILWKWKQAPRFQTSVMILLSVPLLVVLHVSRNFICTEICPTIATFPQHNRADSERHKYILAKNLTGLQVCLLECGTGKSNVFHQQKKNPERLQSSSSTFVITQGLQLLLLCLFSSHAYRFLAKGSPTAQLLPSNTAVFQDSSNAQNCCRKTESLCNFFPVSGTDYEIPLHCSQIQPPLDLSSIYALALSTCGHKWKENRLSSSSCSQNPRTLPSL